jgi:hypothetical protein
MQRPQLCFVFFQISICVHLPQISGKWSFFPHTTADEHILTTLSDNADAQLASHRRIPSGSILPRRFV